MHLPHPMIRTMWGLARLPQPPLRNVALTPAEIMTLVRALEREADAARAERRDATADSLDVRAADLREAAR